MATQETMSYADKRRMERVIRDKVIADTQEYYDRNPVPCQNCSSTEDVCVTFIPFDEEIYDRHILVVWCAQCQEDNYMDV